MNEAKEFKVVSVSVNTNSFGLHGMILMARDGECWEVGASYFRARPKGTILIVTDHNWAEHGFEIPDRKPDAPAEVVAEVWK